MKIEIVFTEADAHKILQDYKTGKDICLTDACPTREIALCNICEICPLKNLNDKEKLKYIFSHIHKEPMMWDANIDDYIEHIADYMEQDFDGS